MDMRKWLLFVLALMLAMPVALAEADLANPWVDCGMDLAKAVETAGFDFAIPALSNYTVRAIPGEMIEVRYPRSEADAIELRKSPMEPDEGDISGDFTEYPESAVIELESGPEIATRGEGGTVYVASFVAFDGAYSVRCAAGMTQDEALQIVEELLAANAK